MFLPPPRVTHSRQHPADPSPCCPQDAVSYAEAFTTPRVVGSLSPYMREPGQMVALSSPAFAMEVISSETEEIREWLYTQTVAVSNSDESGITMLYTGLSDGRFVGYYNPTSYGFRAAGSSVFANISWAPYATAAGVPLNLSDTRPKCDLDAATDGSDVCPTGCSFTATECTGTPSTAYSIGNPCSGSTADACTSTAADGTAGCCDKNIRALYTTSVQDRGVPVSLTGWSTYDHRVRPWYTEELARSQASTSVSGWSSVYAFASSRQLGITRTSTMT